jgi:DnaJ-class molecular chaperone
VRAKARIARPHPNEVNSPVPQDPYQTLGVSRSASAEDIRKAFRKLAKANHPDVNPGNKAAEERFKRASAAFDILGDPEKKARFDRGEIGADGREQPKGFTGGFTGGGPFSGRPGRKAQGAGAGNPFQGADFEDILSEIMGGRAGAGFNPRGPMKGEDMRLRLEIELEEAIRGGPKRISLPDGQTLDLTLPTGAKDDQVLRLRGKGGPGRQGGPAGDALIELVIKPHPVFRREQGSADLTMDLPVSVPDAMLGARIDAPTPEGPVALTIPPRSNSGQMLRLKAKGAYTADGRRGDLLARLVVMLPDAPDEALVRFASDWRDKRPYAPKRKP